MSLYLVFCKIFSHYRIRIIFIHSSLYSVSENSTILIQYNTLTAPLQRVRTPPSSHQERVSCIWHQTVVFVLRPTTERVWHKAFLLDGSGRRAGAHTRPTFPKMPTAPSAFPLSGAFQAPGNNPPWRVKAWGEAPLRPKEISRCRDILGRIPKHGRPKCYRQRERCSITIWHQTASDGDATIFDLWGMWSAPSLPLLPGPLWPWVVVPVRILSIDQIELFDHFSECKQMTGVKLNCLCYITILETI